MTRNADIIEAVTDFAPPPLQEDYDNTGLQVGNSEDECRGVLLCVDATPEIVEEACERGCNLVISHHPVLFRGVKRLVGATPPERTVIEAIRRGVTIYSSHTSLDSAPGGVSARMAEMLGLKDCHVLEPQKGKAVKLASRLSPEMAREVREGRTGLGMIGRLPSPMIPRQLVELVKRTFDSPVARCSRFAENRLIEKVGLCGGSGSDMIDLALSEGAQAYITSDVKYHSFVDHADEILIVDIGHWESEYCAQSILMEVIREKFPNFAVSLSQTAENPIHYI